MRLSPPIKSSGSMYFIAFRFFCTINSLEEVSIHAVNGLIQLRIYIYILAVLKYAIFFPRNNFVVM